MNWLFVRPLLLLGVFAFVACYNEADRKRNEKLDAAITALRKISSAVEVGVNYEQYSTLLIEAKAKVDLAKDLFPGDISKQLDTTLDNYVDARKAWGEKFRDWAILDVEDPVSKAILEKYSLPIDTRTWITDDGRRDSANGIEFDDALHEIWRIGQQNLDKLIAASKPK